MSEVFHQFADTYRDTLTMLLDASDQLSLFQTPRTAIAGNPYHGDATVAIDGEDLADIDPVAAGYDRAANQTKAGIISLHRLGAEAMMGLFTSEVKAARGTAVADDFQTTVLRTVETEITAGDFGYAAHEYSLPDDGQTLTIVVMSLTGAIGLVRARRAVLLVRDELVERELVVSDMPTSLDGSTQLNVNQQLRPTLNETAVRADRFFAAYNAPEDIAVMMNVFYAGLTGRNANVDAVGGLMRKYEALGEFETMRDIFNDYYTAGQAARASNAFKAEYPGAELPSHDELGNYVRLIEQACT